MTADKQLKIYVDGELAASADVTRLIDSESLQDMEIGSDEAGAVLTVVSATDGEVLSQSTYPELPQWDGMAVAGGRLFITTEKGSPVCLAKE